MIALGRDKDSVPRFGIIGQGEHELAPQIHSLGAEHALAFTIGALGQRFDQPDEAIRTACAL